MKKIAVVANQVAGKGHAAAQLLAARAELWGRPLELFSPATSEALSERCARISDLPEDYDALVVIGGDGTLNRVIQASRRNRSSNQVPLFAFPCGTANDLARELNLKPDWNQVQRLVDENKSSSMDLIEVNGIPFSTVAGIGIGALLTSEFNRLRSRSPSFAKLAKIAGHPIYTALTAKTILTRRDYIFSLHIRSTTFEERVKTPALFICNQKQLGSELSVAPDIDNNDHHFNVLVVTTTSRARLLAGMAELKAGKISSDFVVFSANHLTIQSTDGRKIPVFGDGEPLLEAEKLEFSIVPDALRVFRDRGRS